MPNQDDSGEHPRTSSESWAVICDEYPDLQRWAYRTEQRRHFIELRARAGQDEALGDWLALREEMRRRERSEGDVVKETLAHAYERVVNGADSLPDTEIYVCPEQRKCARRAQADAPGEPPRCDLFGSPMKPA